MRESRRTFIHKLAAVAGGSAAGFATGCASLSEKHRQGQVMTVLGPMAPSTLGMTLPHEHVLVDFIGAAQVSRDRYRADEVVEVASPHLQRVKALGCRTLVECTPAFIGRDPALLQRLAQAVGIHLLTNTGYYGASKNKFLPPHAFTETAPQLARRWLREWGDGIEGTGIRPGFIKIGVDGGPLSEVHRKLVRAAAQTHRASGLTIAAHTGNGAAALDEIATVREEGVSGSAFVWVHAQSEKDMNLHLRALELGAWVEFDGISPSSIARHVELVRNAKQRGLLHRVLVSHDAGWYHVGEPGGGKFRAYDTLFTDFLPALREQGFNEADIEQLLVTNPREAFAVQPRLI